MRNAFQIFLLLLISFNAFAQKREVVVQSGHLNRIEEIAFSPNGKMLASGDSKGLVKLWDLNTGKEVRTIQNQVAVNSLAISSDDNFLLISGDDRSVRRYDLSSGAGSWLIGKSGDKFNWRGAALNSAKMLAAQLTEFGNIEVFDLKAGTRIFSYDTPDDPETDFRTRFEKIKFSPDGNLLARASLENIVLLDVSAKKLLYLLKCSDSNILEFDFDGQRLAAIEKSALTGKNQTIKIFSVKSRSVSSSIKVPDGEVKSLTFSRDGTKLAGVVKTGAAIADESYSIRLWDISTGRQIAEKKYEKNTALERLSQIKFSPGDKMLAVAVDERIDLFDAAMRSEITQLKRQSNPVETFKFTTDGSLFAKAVGGNLQAWNLTDGKQKVNLSVADYDVSSDGQKLAAYNTLSGTYEITDIKTGKQIGRLNEKGFKIMSHSVVFSPKDKYLLAFCPPYLGLCGSDNKIRLFDSATGNLIFTFPDSSAKAVFSSDEKLIAYVILEQRKAAIKIWDIENKKELETIPLKESIYPTIALNFSPSNNLLAFSNYVLTNGKGENFLKIYNIKSGKIERTSVTDYKIDAIVFSLDETVLITSFDEKIKFLNVSDGKEIVVLSAHSNWVESLAFSRDGKFLVSGAQDGQIVFWNYQTREIAVRLILTGESDFLFVAPDNYYLASRRGAASAIAFRQGNRAYPFEQFDIRFNRPDLALRQLGTISPEQLELYKKAYQKRLRQNGLTEADLSDDLALPQVIFDTQKIPLVTKEKTLRFNFSAEDGKYALGKLNVYVNDVAIYGAKGFSLSGRNAKFFKKDVNLELVEGNNRIQISAVNEKGIESIRQTFNVKYEGASPKPELYLVAVGVARYKNEKYNLKYPADDAANIAALFENRSVQKEKTRELSPNGIIEKEQPKSFYRIHKLELTDENAVLEKIGGIRNFLKNARPEDEVVVFISGHGLLDKEKNYLFATHDVDFQKPEKRGLSFEKLEDLIDQTAARRKIILLDTCHAGEVDKSEIEDLKMSAPKAEGVVKGIDIAARSIVINLENNGLDSVDQIAGELFADLRLGSGAIVISASGGLEYAYESPRWSGGVFTYSVRLGLEEMQADENDDGKISVSELRDFVGRKVSELTEGRQKPNTRRESVEFDFRIF